MLHERLGTARIVEVESLRIGLTHGHAGPGRMTPERARLTFARTDPPVDAIAFGHSHQPMVERIGRLWLINPGSPTDRRRQPTFTYIRLEIEDCRIVPELVTHENRR